MNFQFSKKKLERGQLLVEILVAFGLSSLLMPAIFSGFIAGSSGKVQETQRSEALAYLKEAEEAVRSVRETSWSTFAVDGTYHPARSGNAWILAGGSEVLNGFTRVVEVANAYRNSSGMLVDISGTNDPSTKKITLSVSWGTLPTQAVNNSYYLTRFLKNATWVQTTKADFDAGTANGVSITNVSGGEVQLGAGGKADWCAPNLSITALDLPKNGVANTISAIPGKVIAGTGENASGVSFANIAVSDTDPPVSTISGTYDGYKTNGIFNDANYAYIATDNHAKEMIILDLNQLNPVTKKYAEVGYFNAPGNLNGKSVAVSGNIGFLTVDNILYSIDLSSKSGSRPQLASKTLAANGTKVVVNGAYVFISIAGATQELQIVQFNPAGTTLTITGSADVNGQAAHDVSVNSTGTRAYLATGVDASKPEFFIIDTSNKSGARPTVGSYNANGMDPNGVAVVTSNKSILVGTGGEEYQVIDISDEAHPTRCGGLNINTGINGTASVLEADGDAYSYIITGDASSELKIIEGGPGGKFASKGNFTSSIFDAIGEAAFNRLTMSFTIPNQTTLSYQVSGIDKVSGSCPLSGYIYVGPDGTDQTYFTTPSAQIPLNDDGVGYENPATCFRYKLFLESNDPSSTPVFSDATINYSQ